MHALDRQPANHAIAAMQAINKVILNGLFLAVFFGTPLLCLIILVLSWRAHALSGFASYGAVLLIVGTFLVTVFGNVPLNNGLSGQNPEDENAQRIWSEYYKKWLLLNHLRTLASTSAMILFLLWLVD